MDNEESVILGDGELRLTHSHNELGQKIDKVRTKLELVDEYLGAS